MAHKRVLEATNAGHYFADCSCGWAGGVHRDRAQAIIAWQAHRDGTPRVEPVRPVVNFEAFVARPYPDASAPIDRR